MQAAPIILFLGLGYVARALARQLAGKRWQMRAAMRDPAQAPAAIAAAPYVAGNGLPAALLDGADYVVVSIPPGDKGDQACADLDAALAATAHRPRWIGYLSATSVYGDHGGALVDETTLPRPSDRRGQARLAAEQAWLRLGQARQIPVAVFRLAGIYGPGRSALDQARAGTARRIDRPGHLFSRIHVDDIASILQASMARPRAGAIYNVADDEPAAPADVTAHACGLLGIEPPPPISFERARAGMSAMALSFWADNKRVSNALMKKELGIVLRYPNYRAGLDAIAGRS